MLTKTMTDNAHFLIKEAIKGRAPNSLVAMDATMGNGLDLAFLVGCPSIGKVFGFDIQAQAVAASYDRIKDYEDKVELILASHINLSNYIKAIDVGMFNLGYLPHGSKNCTTQVNSSLMAIQETLKRLRPQGIMTVMTYPGHEEGQREHEAIETYLSTQLPAYFLVFQLTSCNVKGHCPRLFVISNQNNKQD